jgi:hypothetical protein
MGQIMEGGIFKNDNPHRQREKEKGKSTSNRKPFRVPTLACFSPSPRVS